MCGDVRKRNKGRDVFCWPNITEKLIFLVGYTTEWPRTCIRMALKACDVNKSGSSCAGDIDRSQLAAYSKDLHKGVFLLSVIICIICTGSQGNLNCNRWHD